MEIKGVSVKAAPGFVRSHFGSRYDEWFASLSESSQQVVENALASNWYPLREAVIEPTEKVAIEKTDVEKKVSEEAAK